MYVELHEENHLLHLNNEQFAFNRLKSMLIGLMSNGTKFFGVTKAGYSQDGIQKTGLPKKKDLLRFITLIAL